MKTPEVLKVLGKSQTKWIITHTPEANRKNVPRLVMLHRKYQKSTTIRKNILIGAKLKIKNSQEFIN